MRNPTGHIRQTDLLVRLVTKQIDQLLGNRLLVALAHHVDKHFGHDSSADRPQFGATRSDLGLAQNAEPQRRTFGEDRRN